MKRISNVLFAMLVALFSAGAMAGDKVSPESVAGATTVDTAQAKALFDKGVLFIDVRSDKDWAAGRIPDAVHIELKKVFSPETLGAQAKKDQEIVIYCNGHSCMRSSHATANAVEWGYTKVNYFRDGFPAWKAAGYPVE